MDNELCVGCEVCGMAFNDLRAERDRLRELLSESVRVLRILQDGMNQSASFPQRPDQGMLRRLGESIGKAADKIDADLAKGVE